MTDDAGLKTFLGEAAQHRLLTAAEERALGRRVRSGTVKEKSLDGEWRGTRDATTARNELVLCNIRLVVSVARYYRNRGLTDADVVQEGILGLNRAAEKFDPDKDIRFSTYATLWIKQAIQRGLSKGSAAIRLPSTLAGNRAKVRGYQLRNPEATLQDVADSCDLELADVVRALEAAEVVTSLDREIGTDETAHTLLDALADPHADDPHHLVDDDLSPLLAVALDALSLERRPGKTMKTGRQHRRVIEMNFGIGCPQKSLKEIEATLGGTKKGNSLNTIKSMRRDGMAWIEAYFEREL
jgi:RNA polymerase primary sigma factor